MSTTLTPSGTRGGTMPHIPGFLNNAIFFIFRGRPFSGLRLLRLTTIGARSGRPRRSTLGYFAESDRAWVFNLAKHPDQVWVELDRQKIKVRPETLQGEERASMWRRVVAAAPNYG